MQIAVVQFPGSNCERETMLAIKRAGMEPVEFLWNESSEKLRGMAGFVIVGGFSYEDRSRAGIIAALDPVMREIKAQSELGKPVLGICNGAQILVEAGLVPGLENNKLTMALTENKRIANGKILGTGYYNSWVHVRLSDQYQRNAFTRHLTPKHILRIPVAHGEGRFVMADALLREMKNQGLNVLQYCDEQGEVIDRFPVNPNGSVDNIAAVSNKSGNVMAIMPHPERTLVGDALFSSMREYIEKGYTQNALTPLDYYPRRELPQKYDAPAAAKECLVELIITDNQALTVQNTLRQLGVAVTVRRMSHWEIQSDDRAVIEQIKKCGVLFNSRKEMVIGTQALSARSGAQGATLTYLVRAKEDLHGQQKKQMLNDHFNIHHVRSIAYGTLWQFIVEDADKVNDLKETLLQTSIIRNPYAHDYYEYI